MLIRKSIVLRVDSSIVLLLFILLILGGSSQPHDEIMGSLGTVVIDPGHGGSNIGAVGYSGTLEKNNTLPMALMVAELLEENDVDVILTRESDIDVSISQRVGIAKQADADILVSIHCDWNHNPNIKGTATYYFPQYFKGDRDRVLSEIIQRNLVNAIGSRDLGVRKYEHLITSWSSVPTALVEVGFMSNPEEEMLLKDKSYQLKAAEGIKNGIIEYLLKQLE